MKKIYIGILISAILFSRVGAYSNFYWGQCTWYVASKKNVEWRGNAKDWYNNASNMGRSVGYNPVEGAIIVFDGPDYHELYGHVGIVEKVGEGYIIISEMNLRKLNQVTLRIIYNNDPNVIGYIYSR